MKFNAKSLEKAFFDVAKNAKLGIINCPQCKGDLWNHSFKELNKLWSIFCETCNQDVKINMDNIDKKLK